MPPLDEGRPTKWLGDELLPSVVGDNAEVPHAFEPEDDGRLPQLRVPLNLSQIKPV